MASPAGAQPEDADRAALEADLFGGGPEATPEATPASADREAALFGDAPPEGGFDATPDAGDGTAAMPSDRAIEAMLDEAYDPLTLGARFALRFDYSNFAEAEAEPADPAAALTAPRELSSPALIDLYLDGRPSRRVRAFVGARVQQDLITSDDFFDLPLVQLDEAWLKFDVGRAVFLTVGKQRIKWGAARFWNPTDFLNRQRLDPLSVIDLRLGVPLIKVHVPFEAAGGNLYAIALLDGATELSQVGGAGRVEWVIGPSEVSATVVGRQDAPLRIGADISAGVGPLEVRAEGAVTHGGDPEDGFGWRGTWDAASLGTGDVVRPDVIDRSDDWLPQAVLSVEWGIPYGDDDTLYVTGEYFYNGAGDADAALLPWRVGTGSFEALYAGRHYAGLNVALMAPGDWDDHTFLLSGLANLSDGSGFVRLDHQVTVLTRLRVSSYVGAGVGAKGGEFRLAGEAPSFAPGADVLVDDPVDAFTLAAPRFLAGMWLTVDI